MAKKAIAVRLYMPEIIYDVQNKTYLTGRSRDNGNNAEAVANMQADNEAENASQVMRSIGNAYAAMKNVLAEYISESGTTTDNELADDADITVMLMMPSNYNSTVNSTISAAMHQYIVNTAIADWFMMTNKTDASDYLAASAANLSQINEAIQKRVRPTKVIS